MGQVIERIVNQLRDIVCKMSDQTILIVDDEKNLLLVLKKNLEMEGFRVFTAENGLEALSAVKETSPDLIVLDISMSGMDGAEVSTELKENPRTKNIPIIFLTALYSKNQEIKKGNFVGGNVFMSKPYEIDELIEMINLLLARASIGKYK